MDKLKRYWNPILLLLATRRKTAVHEFTSNPGGVMGRVFIAVLAALAAFSLGHHLSQGWASFTTQEATSQSAQFWIKVQFFWFIALLLPGVVALFGRPIEASLLRAFKLGASQLFFAEVLGLLCDTPTLLVVFAALPLFFSLPTQGAFVEMIVLFFGLLAVALQTAALATLCLHFNSLFGSRVKKLSEVPAFTAILLFLLL